MDINGKSIFVTGASQGIGRALSDALARDGANLILVARSGDKLKEFVEKNGDNHRYYVCDLSNQDEILRLIESVKKDIGHLDVLANVAGVGIYKNLEGVSDNDWQNSFSVNVTAPFLLTKNLLPLLQKRQDSFVLNIGSGLGTMPNAGKSTYCATKFALRGWSLSLSEEFAGRSPQFCLITLGSTMTNFGGKSIEERQKEYKAGRAYFPVEWLADKFVEIIKDDKRQAEITLSPLDFGFGKFWNKQ